MNQNKEDRSAKSNPAECSFVSLLRNYDGDWSVAVWILCKIGEATSSSANLQKLVHPQTERASWCNGGG